MNKAPAFQFYPKDWMDFKVQRMSYEAQGIYMKLLCFMWSDSKDQYSILNDDHLISKSLGMSLKKWMKIKEEFFYKNDPIFLLNGSKIISPRLRKEVRKIRAYKRKQAEKGKKSGVARRKKKRTAVEQRFPPVRTEREPNANRTRTETKSSSSSSSSSSNKKKEDTKVSSKEIPDWIPKKEFEEYEKMRRKIKKPMTDKAIELAIKKLEALKKEGNDPKEVLEQSILNSWQGLFPLKSDKKEYQSSQIGKSSYIPSEKEKKHQADLESYRNELLKKYKPQIEKAKKLGDQDALQAIEDTIRVEVAQKSQEM